MFIVLSLLWVVGELIVNVIKKSPWKKGFFRWSMTLNCTFRHAFKAKQMPKEILAYNLLILKDFSGRRIWGGGVIVTKMYFFDVLITELYYLDIADVLLMAHSKFVEMKCKEVGFRKNKRQRSPPGFCPG
ncbi:MAG: hypothetical protein J7L69_01755 [Desulfobulbaceae bacterium]|nr:hypothetical protein [Desulfobulbaceae bacterium]